MARRFLALLLVAAPMAHAGTVSVPHVFQSNTPALASEVNANFSALVSELNAAITAIETLQLQVANQQTTITQLQAELATAQATIGALEGNSVLDLDGLLRLEVDGSGFDTARFDGVNVQITNGLDATNGSPGDAPFLSGMVNGLGNLIVGYNEVVMSSANPNPVCSDGSYGDQTDCEDNGAIWASNQRSGSHNIVVGPGHSYTSHGALIAGYGNAATRAWAAASGGFLNVSRGLYSVVSGGQQNEAVFNFTQISGGSQNTAAGTWSSISGGNLNTTSADHAVVSGGGNNEALGVRSTVTGGSNNDAVGIASSISGGVRISRQDSAAASWVALSMKQPAPRAVLVVAIPTWPRR